MSRPELLLLIMTSASALFLEAEEDGEAGLRGEDRAINGREMIF